MKKPWCMVYWSGRPTEDWMFATAYMADSGWNDTFWKHERFNKIVLEARSELNEAKRAELYAEAQLIIRDEGGVVVPMYASYVFAMSDKVKHNTMAGDWDLDGLRGLERWWFG
jgi:peptide/nickel transport system substrate-binding protein